MSHQIEHFLKHHWYLLRYFSRPCPHLKMYQQRLHRQTSPDDALYECEPHQKWATCLLREVASCPGVSEYVVFFPRKDGSNKNNMELWNWTLSFSVSWTAGHPVELWNGLEVPLGKLLGWGGKHHGWLCLHCLLPGHSKPLVLPCLDSNFELVISKNWLKGH